MTLQECQTTGFDVYASALLEIQFLSRKLSLSGFRLLSHSTVLVVNCELNGTDFHGVDLRACRFDRCTMAGSLFHEATADGVDLRGSSTASL